MTLLPPGPDDRWFLLARRPGWRESTVLSVDVAIDDGRLRLGDGAPQPSVFDCASATCVRLPCCEHAILTGDQVLVVTGTGQLRLVLGPLDVDGTPWHPDGVMACGRLIGVIDRGARIVYLFDAAGRYLRAVDGRDLPGCPRPDGIARYATQGRFVSLALDSGMPECEWHRVAVRGTVPVGGRVVVSTLTTDADLAEGEVALLDPSRWTVAGMYDDPAIDEWDALVGGPKGRYLWLAVELDSDGAVTPALDDVEVHFPRRTSLRHLPAVFRSGPDGGAFVDRYLALTDAVRSTVVGEIDHLPWELDARSATTTVEHDFLGWLGEWVGMTGTDLLPTRRRRALIGRAAELYRRRGTPDGVARFVGLWLGRRTQVLEHYRLRRWAVLDRGRLGDATRLFGPSIVKRLQLDEYARIGAFQLVDTPSPRLDPFAVYAHRFTLFVHACVDDDVEQLAATAARVIGTAQPAHTVSSVAVVQARMTVGEQASLGLDAVVAGPLPPGRLGTGRLGDGPVVVARDPARGDRPAVGIDARVGTRAAIV